MITAPMILLEDTAQAADIRSSKAPSNIINGYARVKTYIKSDDWSKMISSNGFGVRRLPFDQPFQVASEVSGLDWNATNRAFMCQLAECNLRCEYCYVDRSGFLSGTSPKTMEVSALQFVEDYAYHNSRKMEATGRWDSGVIRYSGGEPFLFQEWLAESVECASRGAPFVWIDTNLTISLKNPGLSLAIRNENVAVCGCFKPGIRNIDDQMRIVHQLVSKGVNLFLYYPSHGGTEVDMSLALEGLSDVHPNLPLRICVIDIRWSYAAMKDRRGTVGEGESAESLERRRKIWSRYVSENCDPDLLHLPSHQVPIWKDGRPTT